MVPPVVERLARYHRSPLSQPYSADARLLTGEPSPNRLSVRDFAIPAVAICAGLLIAPPAFAGYGAVAYDTDARKSGFAWDAPTQAQANDAAKRDCASDNCQLRFGVPPGKCAAFATPDDGPAWGGAVRKSLDAAAFAAIVNCQKHADAKCIVRQKKCTK